MKIVSFPLHRLLNITFFCDLYIIQTENVLFLLMINLLREKFKIIICLCLIIIEFRFIAYLQLENLYSTNFEIIYFLLIFTVAKNKDNTDIIPFELVLNQ